MNRLNKQQIQRIENLETFNTGSLEKIYQNNESLKIDYYRIKIYNLNQSGLEPEEKYKQIIDQANMNLGKFAAAKLIRNFGLDSRFGFSVEEL
jgi:hypothetical protein